MDIFEYRGVEGLVCAEVLKDNNDTGAGEGYVTGTVFEIAGVAELGRATENSSESHYYDNMPAIVISSTGADTVTITASAIPLDVMAKITGQQYDENKGIFIEGQRTNKYFAIGYKTKDTRGKEVYVWRLKGQFSIPDETHVTENDGTDANGQEITYTGISTTHKFAGSNNKGCKAINVEVSKGLVSVENFFNTVQTPDSLTPIAKVATPVATPVAGAVTSGTTVELSCSTAGVAIHYTVDGSVPTESSPVYSTAITIDTAKTIKAIAVKSGMLNSDVLSASYTIA